MLRIRAAACPARLTDSPALDLAPSWSGDGRSLYFASNRSGAWEIWRQTAVESDLMLIEGL